MTETRIKEVLAMKNNIAIHINEQVEFLENYIFERKLVKVKIEIPDVRIQHSIVMQHPKFGIFMTTELKLMDYMFNQALKYYLDKYNQ